MIYRSDNRLIFCHLVILFCVGAATFFFTMRTTKSERQEYQNLVAETLKENYPIEYEADQMRDDIYREIVLTHKGTRLQTRLTADRGILTLKQDGDQIVFKENMDNISCVMQEELIFEKEKPMQLIRVVKADHAAYDFKTNRLVTDEMQFERYKIEGHQLPKNLVLTNPTMTGYAKSATITFTDSGPKLQADHLKVKVWGGQ